MPGTLHYRNSKKDCVDFLLYHYFNHFMEFRTEEEVDICAQLAYFDLTFYCDFILRIY